ncbi:MAG: hypothetical protein JWO36_5183 [Myxococcales bacterium]|nr:hypothetical protein [Myxococcales bacterium]
MGTSTKSRKTGQCAACDVYKRLTDSGLIKLHKRHDVTCPGSLLAPKPIKPKATDEWACARKATLARDNHACRKCGAPDQLDVHHKIERVFGGGHELENLITLCGDCHREWTFCEPPIEFEVWRGLPQARFIVAMFAQEWPHDISANQFKENLLNAMALLLAERNQRRADP